MNIAENERPDPRKIRERKHRKERYQVVVELESMENETTARGDEND